MKRKAFAPIGVVLVGFSLFASYFEFRYALNGSAEAWMALSALLCAGVLGVGMVRVGRTRELGNTGPLRRDPK